MKRHVLVTCIVLLSGSCLSAARNTLKVKNKTGEQIEFRIHAGDSQSKMIEAGKSAHFSIDMTILGGFDWKIQSKSKPKCRDWYVLDKKDQVINLLSKQVKDSELIIEENGGFQSITGKSVQKVHSMKPFSDVCSK